MNLNMSHDFIMKVIMKSKETSIEFRQRHKFVDTVAELWILLPILRQSRGFTMFGSRLSLPGLKRGGALQLEVIIISSEVLGGLTVKQF